MPDISKALNDYVWQILVSKIFNALFLSLTNIEEEFNLLDK
mgnify:CR=1 FL=1